MNTPALDALLQDAERLNLPGPTGVTLTTMGQVVIVGPDSMVSRLAAMLRVAVDALDAGFNLVNGRAECRRALARIEAMAKGDA